MSQREYHSFLKMGGEVVTFLVVVVLTVVVLVVGEEGMVPIDAGVVAVGRDVGQEELVFLGAEQLLVGLQANLLQLRYLLPGYQTVYSLLLQTALPNLTTPFLGSPFSPNMYPLNLNIQASLLEHHLTLLPLPHPALEEVANRIKHRHLKIIIADHLGYESCQFCIACGFHYLPLARFTHRGNVGLVLTLLCYLLLFLACQETVRDGSEVEDQVLLEFFRRVVSFILAVLLKLRIFLSHPVSDHMFLLRCFRLEERLEVQHLQCISVEVYPLRHDDRGWMDTGDLLDSLQQVAEQLIEPLLRDLLNRVGEGQRAARRPLENNEELALVLEDFSHFGEDLGSTHELDVSVGQHRVPTESAPDSLHEHCLRGTAVEG